MSSPVLTPDPQINVPSTRMAFTLLEPPAITGVDIRFDESLMQYAVREGPAACIWQAPQGLVVPRTYVASPTFEDVCQQFAMQGWPVSVRHSGGGVVPQGPGILNISLAYGVQGRPLDHSDAAYQLLCDVMSDAVADFGVFTQTQAVHGSFCDGRFNLAYGPGDNAQKIAGTAQLWRQQRHPDGHTMQVVLVHGLLLVATDIDLITQQANELEHALGHDRRYESERAVSLHELVPTPRAHATQFVQQVGAALRNTIQNAPGAARST